MDFPAVSFSVDIELSKFCLLTSKGLNAIPNWSFRMIQIIPDKIRLRDIS